MERQPGVGSQSLKGLTRASPDGVAWCGVSESEQDEERIYVGGQLVMGNEWPQAGRTGIVSGRDVNGNGRLVTVLVIYFCVTTYPKTQWLRTAYICYLSFCVSGIWTQPSWMPLAQSLSQSYNLKTQLREDLLPSTFMCLLAWFSFSQAVDRGPQFLYGCWPEAFISSFQCGLLHRVSSFFESKWMRERER